MDASWNALSGQLLDMQMRRLGLGNNDFARHCQIPGPKMANYRHGKTGISSRMLRQLAQAIPCSLEDLTPRLGENGKGSLDKDRFPEAPVKRRG